ncbi:inactive serine protease 54 [Python bivittatus]|uniref:Inactive serine protease 54 n=1 Tax=Python bivittatus TaxID=176946 RepID=A0A9F5JC62_PYTBI|nr:inactive serine protease 54 [Python bivittatus]
MTDGIKDTERSNRTKSASLPFLCLAQVIKSDRKKLKLADNGKWGKLCLQDQHAGILLLLSVFTLPSSIAAAGCGRQARLAPTNSAQEAATVGGLPWMVSLQDQDSHIAFGSILSKYWILSAASSFHSRTQISALAGASDLEGHRESLVPIQTIIPHKAFDEITLVHNVALLKASTPFRFSETTQPVCFPAPDFPVATLGKCLVAGWLDPRGGNGPPQKLSVEDVDRCPLRRTTSTECCSHRESGSVPGCLGSAGNPVLCEAEGAQVLKGVLSEGGARCYGPFLYSQVIHYSDWIVTTTAKWGAPASPFPGQRYSAFAAPVEEHEGLLFEPFLELRALDASNALENPLSLNLSEKLNESSLGLPEGPAESRVNPPLYYDYYGGELLPPSSAEPGQPQGLRALIGMGFLLRLRAC